MSKICGDAPNDINKGKLARYSRVSVYDYLSITTLISRYCLGSNYIL